MNGKMSKAAIAAAMTVSMVGLQAPMAATAAEGDFSLTIMHTNDTHANLDNVAKRVTLVDQIRSENANNLLLDAGDVFSGTLYFNEFQGAADLAFMNLMQYDAMTFGNHEFDLGGSAEGHSKLAEFVNGAEFPFVAANVDFSADANMSPYQNSGFTAEFENGEIYDGIVKTIDGEQVGIFGLTTEETASISSPGNVSFSNYIEAAEEAVAAFEAAGVNKIVALTHIGLNDSANFDNDMLLAEAVEGIDVIVGGHTHVELEEPVVVETHEDPVVIVQANEYNNFLGQLDVVFDVNGVITSYAGQLHDVEAAEEDAEAAELLAPYAEQIEEVKNTSTGGEALVPLDGTRGVWGVRAGETNLGNLITDGMLAKAKTIDPETVIAVQNGGGIRASIDTGEITVGEVLTVLPFSNSLAIMDITGQELKEALEHSVSAFPAESGGFLHVAGLKFYFDPNKAVGSKVTEMFVDDGETLTPVQMDQFYKVATNIFTAKGGDDFTVFEEAYNDGRVTEPGNMDFQMFIDYVAELGEVSPTVENRINAAIPFVDVAKGSWSYPYVRDLYYQEITYGTSATTYSPLRDLTRVEAVALITRILDLDTEAAPDAPFKDISHLSAKRQDDINAAYEIGLIHGMSNGDFVPNAEISRAHFAIMLERVYEHVNGDYDVTEYAPFNDYGGFNNHAKEAITVMYELGIVTGDRSDNFMPAKYTNRAETAKMISKLLPYVE